MILSYEETLTLLDKIADSFPPAFYKDLNGAVLLLPEANRPPDDPGLYTMGCYCRDQLGRRIELYYGSFAALAREEDWEQEDWEEELLATLSHEFTHHMESLAGERSLEIKDELFMEAYHEGKPPKPPRFFRKKSRSSSANPSDEVT